MTDDKRCSKNVLIGGVATLGIGKMIVGLGVLLLIIFGFFKYYGILVISDWAFIGIFIAIVTALVIFIIGAFITSTCGAKELEDFEEESKK